MNMHNGTQVMEGCAQIQLDWTNTTETECTLQLYDIMPPLKEEEKWGQEVEMPTCYLTSCSLLGGLCVVAYLPS